MTSIVAQAHPFRRKFAWGLLIPFSGMNPAVRLGEIARTILSRWPVKRLADKPLSDLTYLTMTSRADWLTLRESLVSLHRAWHSLPKLTVLSDGSWACDEFLEAFQFWPLPIQLLMPDDILAPLRAAGHADLVSLAREHPLGLKLASIISLSRDQQTLFVDSDILWYSDPQAILERFNRLSGPSVCVESGRSYNEELVRQFCQEDLPANGINSGCVYLKGDLCSPKLLHSTLAEAMKQPKHNFNEQSIIAIAVHTNGHHLPPEFCLMDYRDWKSLKQLRPWREGFHSRHYVGPMRHQLYRDAFKWRLASILSITL